MQSKKNYFLISLIYFLIFISNALFLSFFQIFLASKGFNESKIGIISSITPLLCIIANPLCSLIGKNNKRIRYLLLALSVLEAIVILLVYKVNEFSLLILVMCLVAIIDPPLFVILDSYTSSLVKENDLNFSYIRIVGTFSYALGTFISGLIIENFGYSLLFISASILMIISSIVILFLKENKNNEEREKGDFKRLLSNKNFLIIGIYFIFILSFASLGDTYISIYLTNELNLKESGFGLVSSLWVVIELLVVLILNKFNIKNEKLLLIIMGISYLSRLLFMGLEVSLPLAIFGALLRGVGMGINIYLYVPLIIKLVKGSNISSALLLIALFKSILSTVFISISGFFIESNGYSMIFIIWSILFIFVILGYHFISKKMEKESFY